MHYVIRLSDVPSSFSIFDTYSMADSYNHAYLLDQIKFEESYAMNAAIRSYFKDELLKFLGTKYLNQKKQGYLGERL